MAVKIDVIVRRDPALLPFGVLVWLVRERLERWQVERLEECPARGAELAHQPGIELIEQLADRLVQLLQREELPVAQARQDEPLDNQHAVLDLGLPSGRQLRVIRAIEHP